MRLRLLPSDPPPGIAITLYVRTSLLGRWARTLVALLREAGDGLKRRSCESAPAVESRRSEGIRSAAALFTRHRRSTTIG